MYALKRAGGHQSFQILSHLRHELLSIWTNLVRRLLATRVQARVSIVSVQADYQREEYEREMTRVSRVEDVKNDSFARLFSKDGCKTPPCKPTGTAPLRRLRGKRVHRPAPFAPAPGQRSYWRRPASGGSRPAGKARSTGQRRAMFHVPVIAAGLVILFSGGFAGGSLLAGLYLSPGEKPGVAMAVSAQPPAPERPRQRPVAPAAPVHAAVAPAEPVTAAPVTVVQPRPAAPVAAPPPVRPAGKPQDLRQSAASLLATGHTLESEGDVDGARRSFARAFELGSATAALALGKSYDPRFATATGAGEQANGALARKWYEKWYLLGVESGQIPSKVRYDRLIRGLQHG